LGIKDTTDRMHAMPSLINAVKLAFWCSQWTSGAGSSGISLMNAR
jgi:hypothetical protein